MNCCLLGRSEWSETDKRKWALYVSAKTVSSHRADVQRTIHMIINCQTLVTRGQHWDFTGIRKRLCWWLRHTKSGNLLTWSVVGKLYTDVRIMLNCIYRKQCECESCFSLSGTLVRCYLLHREGEVSWCTLALSDEEGPIVPLFV